MAVIRLTKSWTNDVLVLEGNPYSVVRRGREHCVVKTQGGETMKCYDGPHARDLALKYHAALEANVKD